MPKTSTERGRAFRERKCALAPPRKPPKSAAQRNVEYRARKRALKAEPEITVEYITSNNTPYPSFCNTKSQIIVVKTEDEDDPLAINEKDQFRYQELSPPLKDESLLQLSETEIKDEIIPNVIDDHSFHHFSRFIAAQTEIIRSILQPESHG